MFAKSGDVSWRGPVKNTPVLVKRQSEAFVGYEKWKTLASSNTGPGRHFHTRSQGMWDSGVGITGVHLFTWVTD